MKLPACALAIVAESPQPAVGGEDLQRKARPACYQFTQDDKIRCGERPIFSQRKANTLLITQFPQTEKKWHFCRISC